MTRTTPPRPIDIAAAVPGLAAYARTTLRLHPRRGFPTVVDNSVGGPLLWPIDEPWPTCDVDHGGAAHGAPVAIAGVRRFRELNRARWAEGRDFTEAEEQEWTAFIGGGGTPHMTDDRPTPMLPILQLHLHDAHGVVTGPDGADLLQVLWCPFGHEPENVPRTSIYWRKAADVDQVLLDPPIPVVLEEEDFLPEPCILHPEPVTEYPPRIHVPAELDARLKPWGAWDSEPSYQDDLSVAPGWKLGGWAPVSFRDIRRVTCECGAEMRPLLYIDCCEWDQGSTSWRPLEEYDPAANPSGSPTHLSDVGVSIHGDGMQIYSCPVSLSHPHAEWNQ
jgi:hypothetical protein